MHSESEPPGGLAEDGARVWIAEAPPGYDVMCSVHGVVAHIVNPQSPGLLAAELQHRALHQNPPDDTASASQ